MVLRAKLLKKLRTLPAVHPNKGTEAIFRRKLDRLIQEMNDSVLYWLSAAYKANEPVIAQDELPSAALKRIVNRLRRRWQRKFDEAGPLLGKYYAQSAERRSAKQLEQILRDAGFSVQFKMTRPMQDVMNATINEQVGLIKSIPQKYFTEIEGMVMRSVSTGRDLGPLAKSLQAQYGVTRRRAALIARDQNNKATASMTRVRQQELGITEAIWMHSAGGKEPRPTHVKNDGKRYDVAKGWFDPAVGKFIHPGELISCRCVSRSVVPGFE